MFRVQRNFLLASTGQTDPDVPLTGTGPEQAAKIREVKEMGNGRSVQDNYPTYSSFEIMIFLSNIVLLHSFSSRPNRGFF